MNHLNIVVSGEVQRVGYRDRVTKIARKCHITGIVKNCEGYDVEIFAEGREEDLKEFIVGFILILNIKREIYRIWKFRGILLLKSMVVYTVINRNIKY